MEDNGSVPTFSFIFLSYFGPNNASLLAIDPAVDKGYVKDNDEIILPGTVVEEYAFMETETFSQEILYL